MCGPEVVVPDLLLHRVDDGTELLVERVELAVRVAEVERLDPLGHELPRPVELLLELRLGREIPGHPAPFVVRPRARAAGVRTPASGARQAGPGTAPALVHGRQAYVQFAGRHLATEPAQGARERTPRETWTTWRAGWRL